MTVYEIIEQIEDRLTRGGYNVTADPYSDFEVLRRTNPEPLILLEDGTTEFETAALGHVHRQTHTVDLTVMVNTKDRTRKEYKTEVTQTAKQVIDLLSGLRNTGYRIYPQEQVGNEFMAGNLKLSGISITLKINVGW